MTIVYNDPETGAVTSQRVTDPTDAAEYAATFGLGGWELLDDQDQTVRVVYPPTEVLR